MFKKFMDFIKRTATKVKEFFLNLRAAAREKVEEMTTEEKEDVVLETAVVFSIVVAIVSPTISFVILDSLLVIAAWKIVHEVRTVDFYVAKDDVVVVS